MAASVTPSICLVSIVPNVGAGKHVWMCLVKHHLCEHYRLPFPPTLCSRIAKSRGAAERASEKLRE